MKSGVEALPGQVDVDAEGLLNETWCGGPAW